VLLINQIAATFLSFNRQEIRMKPLIISVIAAAGLLVAVTSIPRSHSTIGFAGTGSSSTLLEMQSGRGGKLPVEDFEDRSLVFPRETKR
jgi:O-antigen/teichoic acid export membrane protein